MSASVVVRGSGSIGQRHARVFRQVGADVSLWPVRGRGVRASDDGVDAATGARLLGDATGPAALRDALVVIATDTSRHVADALEALDAGADSVLVEKPVAPTAEDAHLLHEHPRRAAVWVAAPLRAHAAFRHVRRLVGRLEQGGSAHVWSQSWLPDWRPDRDYRESYSARADEGGVLRDLVHEIDYATVLFGPPTLLGASVAIGGPLEIDAEQAATLLWRAGRFDVATRLDYVTRPATRGLVVRSSHGVIEWDVVRAVVRHSDTRRRGDGAALRARPRPRHRHGHAGPRRARPAAHGPGRRALARGAPATLAEGIAAVRLCDAARALGAPERVAAVDTRSEEDP